VNFGPQTKKCQRLILANPNGHFSGDYISAISGCCAVKFLNALEIEQGNLAHTPTATGSPQKKFQSRTFKICPKIQRMSLNNFGAGESILMKLLQTTCREVGVITRVQLLEGLPPKKLGGPKNVKISARFLTTFDFDREYLRNGSTYRTSVKS